MLWRVFGKTGLETSPGMPWKGEMGREMEEWMLVLFWFSSLASFVCISSQVRLGDFVSSYPQRLKLNRACLDFVTAP